MVEKFQLLAIRRAHVLLNRGVLCLDRQIHNVPNVFRVSGAVSHIEMPVLRTVILIRLVRVDRAEIQNIGNGQADAMRPRPVGRDVQVVRLLPAGAGQQPVVALGDPNRD